MGYNSGIMSTSTDNLKIFANPTSSLNVAIMSRLGNSLFKQNETASYEDTPQNKEIIIQQLYQKVEAVENTSDQVYNTGKNLVYYSVFFDNEYIQILELSLISIYRSTKIINFDILFITDESTKQKILTIPILSKFNYFFHIVSTPASNIDSAFPKLNIFDYDKINEYEKILYLDADIICINDLRKIFNNNLIANKLYVKTNTSNPYALTFTSATHGLMYLTDKDASFIDEHTDIIPFNAGQFLFLNSLKMNLHFANVRWLKTVWPGLYFFEQAFMNQYFALNGLTNSNVLDDSVNIISKIPGTTTKSTASQRTLVVHGATNSAFAPMAASSSIIVSQLDYSKKHSTNDTLLHFSGFTLNGKVKLGYIKTYFTYNS